MIHWLGSMWCALSTYNGDLRCLYVERLELAGAALGILRRHRIAHDSAGRIIGHHPFGHPELSFGLLLGLAVAHRDIDGLAVVGEMNHQLRRAIPLARRRVDGGQPEPHRLSPFEPIV